MVDLDCIRKKCSCYSSHRIQYEFLFLIQCTCTCFISEINAAQHCPADLVFVLDGSGSIGAPNWPIMLQFVKDVVNSLDTSVHIGVVVYQSSAYSAFYLNTYSYQSRYYITNTINGIPYPSKLIQVLVLKC